MFSEFGLGSGPMSGLGSTSGFGSLINFPQKTFPATVRAQAPFWATGEITVYLCPLVRSKSAIRRRPAREEREDPVSTLLDLIRSGSFENSTRLISAVIMSVDA